MIIYLEKKYKNNKIAKNIISFYKDAKVLEIDNYKNIFDKNLAGNTEKSIIITWVNNAITKVPPFYGNPGEGYFFKNSLNCVYDCSYCYLKGAFKNYTQVFFVNYDEIKEQIRQVVNWKFKIENDRINVANADNNFNRFLPSQEWHKSETKNFRFYSSDYSDNLATDDLTQFTSEFVPFFETLDNAKMEIRTKSTNIKNLLEFKKIKNTEIAFSINPSEVIEKYEFKTPKLDERIKAINTMCDAWFIVWVRFQPLLEIDNYKEIYTRFLDYIVPKIKFDKVNSIFVWWLMYTYDDYNKMLQKNPYLDLLYKLKKDKDLFYRENDEVRKWFYQIFDEKLKWYNCSRCLDR